MSENKSARYTFRKDGIYYFIRRVPGDFGSGFITSKLRL